MHYSLPKEVAKNDDHLLTACIILIAGFTIILSEAEHMAGVVKVLSACAIACFCLALIFTLWHKYRRALRNEIFEKNKKECYDEFEKDLTALKENAKEFARLQASNYLLQNKEAITKDRDEIFKEIKQLPGAPGEEVIVETFAEKWAHRFRNVSKNSLHGPLNERGRWIKFFVDYLSIKSRYFLFIAGLIFFFASLIARMIME